VVEKADRIGVAVQGLGGYARESVLPELVGARRVRLAGLISRDPAGKGREWAAEWGLPEERVFGEDEVERLAECREIGIVHVITPTGCHARQVVAAAAAGKHVICEKPMAVSAAEARMMIAACREAGVRLGIDYRLAWEPHHRRLVELARGGGYGRPLRVRAEFSWRRDGRKPWLSDRALAAGGVFFDTGVYPLRAGCEVFGGGPRRVRAEAEGPDGLEEEMTAWCEFSCGGVLEARASYRRDRHELVVECERGELRLEGAVFGQSKRGEPRRNELVLPDGRFKVADPLQLAALYEAFADWVADPGASFPATGESGRRDLRVLEACDASVAAGGAWVEVGAGEG